MFKYSANANIPVLLFQFAGYPLGFFLLIAEGMFKLNFLLNISLVLFGSLLLFLVKVQAAYYFHEFAHGNIFKLVKLNNFLGKAVLCLIGNLIPYQILKKQHLNHHARRVDLVVFDHVDYLNRHPTQKFLIHLLEFFMIPASEVLFQAVATRNAWQKGYKGYILIMATSHIILLMVLYYFNPIALIGYFLAFTGMIQMLRLMDTFQHTYPVYTPETMPKDLSRVDDQANTFSNYFESWFKPLNWFTLNFGFHNAHHANPALPWHKLPEFNVTVKNLRGEKCIKPFLKFRIERIMNQDLGREQKKPDNFVGFSGVSFLTGV